MATVSVNDQQFEQEVIQSRLPVLVDFWAPWCGPCQAAGPILDRLADQYQDQLKVVKLNVDENQQRPAEYGVMSIPTVILFQSGKEVARQVGFPGEAGYQKLISQVVKSPSSQD